jgi:hypothetical protein
VQAAVVVDSAASVQLGAENAPVSLEENVTLPDGVLTMPGLLSVTVALHSLVALTPTLGGVQAMAVAVVRVVTVSGLLPELLK